MQKARARADGYGVTTSAGTRTSRRRLLSHRAAVLGLPLALLGVGVGASALVSVQLERSGDQHADQEVRDLAEAEAGALGDAVGTYSSTLQSLATTVGNGPALTEEQFQDLTSTMTSLPGVANITWTVPVADDPAAVAAAQEQLRSQLGTRLTLQPRPTTIGEHRFVASYRAVDTSGTSLGADAASVPQIVQAATSARQTGRVTVTSPYVLIADRGLPPEQQQQSVLFTAPVVGGPGRPTRASSAAGSPPPSAPAPSWTPRPTGAARCGRGCPCRTRRTRDTRCRWPSSTRDRRWSTTPPTSTSSPGPAAGGWR